ncbi:MAG: hypothetical protein JXX29_22130 [Deltaproteobacteria bacterium]|nr:hypothetical protein [Deltaproteobacteria bacterium]MBN2674395.1 hypothetical protein [Deltaproteobacteria bacterium]
MTDNAFDAAGFITVNLDTGCIDSPAQTPMVVVPREVLASLAPSDEFLRAAREWGSRRGEVFAQSVNLAAESLDLFAQHIQGEIALMGLGRASLEVYGDALLVNIAVTESASNVIVEMLVQFISGYFSAQSDNVFTSTILENVDSRLQLFVGSVEAVAEMDAQLQQGVSVSEAIAVLHKEVA